MTEKQALVLLSGGVDSTACVQLLLEMEFQVTGLFVNYSQAALERERESAQRVSQYFNIPLSEVAFHHGAHFGSGKVLGRNGLLIFAAMASGKLSKGIIALGIHSGSNYYDCSPVFIERISSILEEDSDGLIRLADRCYHINERL